MIIDANALEKALLDKRACGGTRFAFILRLRHPEHEDETLFDIFDEMNQSDVLWFLAKFDSEFSYLANRRMGDPGGATPWGWDDLADHLTDCNVDWQELWDESDIDLLQETFEPGFMAYDELTGIRPVGSKGATSAGLGPEGDITKALQRGAQRLLAHHMYLDGTAPDRRF